MLLDPRIAVGEAPLRGEPPDLPADEALAVAGRDQIFVAIGDRPRAGGRAAARLVGVETSEHVR